MHRKSALDDLAWLQPILPPPVATEHALLYSPGETPRPGEAVGVWGYSTSEYYTEPQAIPCTIRALSGQHGRIGLSADLNPGDSGAPVVTAEGKVIGVATAKDGTRDGHAMAIPIVLVYDLLRESLPAATPAGTHLPAVSSQFIGRDADVQSILEKSRRHRVVTITGLGGIGKSELAKAVARAAVGQEWAVEGVEYVDLQNATSAHAASDAVRNALELQPAAEFRAFAEQLRRRKLYVFDDLYQAGVKDQTGLQEWIGALHLYAEPARFLLTHRHLDGPPGVEVPYPLDRLLSPYDKQLFEALAQGYNYQRQPGDGERLDTLLGHLDGYPLALTIAANMLHGSSLENILRQWDRRRTIALKVPGIDEAHLGKMTSVDYSLALSYDQLPTGPVRTLFALFADLPAGATMETLEAVLGDGGYDTVNVLFRRSLVQERAGRYVMLVPVREFGARFLNDGCAPIRQKLDRYLLALAEKWCGDDGFWISRKGEAMPLLSGELANFHAAMDRARAQSNSHFLATMSDALRRFYTFALPGVEAIQRLRDGVAAAHKVKDSRIEANCIQSLGDVHRMLAEYGAARARYEEALPIYRGINARLGEANCIQSLGDVHRMLAEYGAARARYEEALSMYQSIHDRYDVAGTFQRMGHLFAAEGQWGMAIEWMEKSAKVFMEIGVASWAERAQAQAEAWRRGER